MENEHLEIGLQAAALKSADDNEYLVADQLQLLAKNNRIPDGVRCIVLGELVFATCQIILDGYLWLGTLTAKKRSVELRCIVIQLDVPVMVGFYVETKGRTTFSTRPYFRGEERKHHWLFNSSDCFEQFKAQGKNREMAARATMSEFESAVRENKISLDRMKDSYDAWHKDSSVGALSGGLPSLGKRY